MVGEKPNLGPPDGKGLAEGGWVTEASSISRLIQKTFLEGKQEGWQENWKDVPASNRKQGDKILRERTELMEGPVWGFAYCRPLVFGRTMRKTQFESSRHTGPKRDMNC